MTLIEPADPPPDAAPVDREKSPERDPAPPRGTAPEDIEMSPERWEASMDEDESGDEIEILPDDPNGAAPDKRVKEPPIAAKWMSPAEDPTISERALELPAVMRSGAPLSEPPAPAAISTAPAAEDTESPDRRVMAPEWPPSMLALPDMTSMAPVPSAPAVAGADLRLARPLTPPLEEPDRIVRLPPAPASAAPPLMATEPPMSVTARPAEAPPSSLTAPPRPPPA